jgi:serine/threonine protein phosphatase PrpC
MIEHFGACEQGSVRDNNEDYIASHRPEEIDLRLSKGYLFAVADGVGGESAGEVASREAVDALFRAYYANPKRWGRALQEAFQQANLHVYDLSQGNPEYRRMQTTLSAIALMNDQALVGFVGDSRIYQVRKGAIQQLTRDHSEVQELVRMQIITPEEARRHPRRHVITRSIGCDPLLQIEYRSIEVEIGDIFVLCTDGLWEPVEEQEIVDIVTNHPPEAACRQLVELAIERGTCDNLSLQVARVVSWERIPNVSTAYRPSLWERVLRRFGKGQKGE